MKPVPDLLSIAQLDVGSLSHKLGVFLQEVYPPAGVFLQVVKLILKHKTRQKRSFTDSCKLLIN